VELVRPTAERPAVVFGEAMIELSDIETSTCRIGVAGDTYNSAVYLARLGAPVAYATALGEDAFSARIEAAIRREGVEASLIARAPGRAPGLYAVSVDTKGERSFTYWRSASAAREFFDTADCNRILAAAENTPLFLLSGISLSIFDEAGRRRLIDLAARVRARGGVVAFDSNYRPAGWPSVVAARRAVDALAPHVSLALPTYEDEYGLFGDEAPEHTARRWLDAGADEVAVKHGPDGVFIPGSGWIAPPERIAPRDTTGAGDSFNAAYLAARLEGASPADAALAGHRLAAEVLMTPGAIIPRA